MAKEVCEQGSMTRVVTVVYTEPGQPVPCEVLYEKPTEHQSLILWRAQNQTGYCEAQAQKFVEKLKTLGWSCSPTQTSNESADG